MAFPSPQMAGLQTLADFLKTEDPLTVAERELASTRHVR